MSNVIYSKQPIVFGVVYNEIINLDFIIDKVFVIGDGTLAMLFDKPLTLYAIYDPAEGHVRFFSTDGKPHKLPTHFVISDLEKIFKDTLNRYVNIKGTKEFPRNLTDEVPVHSQEMVMAGIIPLKFTKIVPFERNTYMCYFEFKGRKFAIHFDPTEEKNYLRFQFGCCITDKPNPDNSDIYQTFRSCVFSADEWCALTTYIEDWYMNAI
jgi:hypothetical protein